jgi:hypothetical protein
MLGFAVREAPAPETATTAAVIAARQTQPTAVTRRRAHEPGVIASSM